MKDLKKLLPSLVIATAMLVVVAGVPAAQADTGGIAFSSVSHNFGSVAMGQSQGYGVKLTNNSGAAFAFALTLSGPSSFTYADDCNGSVAAGAHCEIIFTYTPTASGPESATWSLAANGQTFTPADGGTLRASAATSPGFTVTSGQHNFGTLPVGATSAAFGVVVSNSTTDAISLSVATVSNHKVFEVVQNTCGSSLPANGTCNIAWNFAPKAQGFVSSTFPISGVDSTTNVPVILTSNGTQVNGVLLEGSGIASTGLTLSSAGFNFGDQGLSTISRPYGAQLTNATNASVDLTYSGSSASFPLKSSTCGASLASDASCEMVWDFVPQATGPQKLVYAISASSSGNPVSITSGSATVSGVTLNGVGLSGTLDLRTGGHNFGPWVVSTTSPNYLTILTNNTGVAVNLGFAYSAGSDNADFTQTNNSCGTTLLAGAKCSLQWDFSPIETGALTTTYDITATDTSNGNSVAVTTGGNTVAGVKLSGNSQATPGVILASSGHNFGEQGVGGGSATYGTTLYNTTGQAINITTSYSNSSAAQSFPSVKNDCGTSLATNSSCNLQWQFTPTTTGPLSVMYGVTATQGGSPVTITSGGNPVNGVALSGTGVQ